MGEKKNLEKSDFFDRRGAHFDFGFLGHFYSLCIHIGYYNFWSNEVRSLILMSIPMFWGTGNRLAWLRKVYDQQGCQFSAIGLPDFRFSPYFRVLGISLVLIKLGTLFWCVYPCFGRHGIDWRDLEKCMENRVASSLLQGCHFWFLVLRALWTTLCK